MCDETHLVGAVGVIRPCDGTIVSERTAVYMFDGVPHVERTVRLG